MSSVVYFARLYRRLLSAENLCCDESLKMVMILTKLERYGISRQTGFLPDEGSEQLPPSFLDWQLLASTIPDKVLDGSLLRELSVLGAFPVEELQGSCQWQRAYVLLAFLTHAVVHGCQEKTVPAKLAEPFLAVCSHMEIEPVLSYAGLCLFNWSRCGRQDLLGGLQCEFSFTGTPDEAAFYLVPVLVELKGGRLPALLTQTLGAAARGDWSTVTQDLGLCSRTITDMTGCLDHLSLCQPNVFYNQIRPFIAGLDVSFERTSDVPLRVKQTGGSAVQSTLFMFLDHVLGVSHRSQMLADMRAYMPGGHRRFLEDITAQPSLQTLMETHHAPSEAWSRLMDCREKLRIWRSRHMAVVTRYIVLPAQAVARVDGREGVNISGTAGSSPLSFLKQMKEDTIL